LGRLTSLASVTPDLAEVQQPTWVPAPVEERLRKAVTLRAGLSVRDSNFGPTAEGIGIIGIIGVGAADGADDAVVAEAVEALSWLRWLEPGDAGIVLARLEGTAWKSICWRYGISRPTADRRYRYALLRSMLGLRRAA
jgi:hypothetical protein